MGQRREQGSVRRKPVRAWGQKLGAGRGCGGPLAPGAGLTEKAPRRAGVLRWRFPHQHLESWLTLPEPALGPGWAQEQGPESPRARLRAVETLVKEPWGWHLLQEACRLVATNYANKNNRTNVSWPFSK